MSYNIEIKRTFPQSEITIGTTVENKEDVVIKLKELHELTESSIKELFPATGKPNTGGFLPSYGVASPRKD